MEFLEGFLRGFFREFFGGFFGRIFFLEEFFWRIFRGFFGRNSTESYLNMERIDLFVKILVFVKILG